MSLEQIQEIVARLCWPTSDKFSILDSTALQIALALYAKSTDGGWVAPCPAHKDRELSLSIRESTDGRIFVDCCAGCSFEEAQAALAARGLWSSRMSRLDPVEEKRRRQERATQDEIEKNYREERASCHWVGCEPVQRGSVAEQYLCSLGLKPPYPQSLREGVASWLDHRQHHDALVAMACRYPFENPVCIQAIPLKEPGVPAWWTRPRVNIGCLPGAAVQLSPWEPGQWLVLVEGVEHGLALAQAYPGTAVWAVLKAANAATVQVPARATVMLCLGEGEAKRKAAALAAVAFQQRGHVVRVVKLPVELAAAAPVHGVAR